MARWCSRWLLVGWLAAPAAGAEPLAEGAGPPPLAAAPGSATVRIRFVTEENLDAVLAVYSSAERRALPLATCHVACALRLPPGEYHVAVVKERPQRGRVPLELREDRIAVVYEHDHSARRTGAALGLFGIPITLSGLVLGGWGFLGLAFCGFGGGHCDRNTPMTAFGVGFVATGVGSTTTVYGWRLHSRGLLPSLEVVPERAAPRAAREGAESRASETAAGSGARVTRAARPPVIDVRAGAIPGVGGVTLGVVARF